MANHRSLKLIRTFFADLDRHEDLLLIVTFHNKTYDDIPLFEVIYRHHFQNILYCGAPDEVVDDYMKVILIYIK